MRPIPGFLVLASSKDSVQWQMRFEVSGPIVKSELTVHS